MCSPFTSDRKTPAQAIQGIGPVITRDYVVAGKAVFTVQVPEVFATAHKTPRHYTYQVCRKPASDQYPEAWMVSLRRTGPENTQDYTYLGMLDTQTGNVRLTAASKYSDGGQPVRILRRVLARVWAGQSAAVEVQGWSLHPEGRCCRCGRRLTTPESVVQGIGPECIRIAGNAAV